MADIKTVLAWADELCTQALTEARGGDTSLVNRLGANSAFKLYFDNVHGLKTVAGSNFPAYYAPQFKEITRLYEEYTRDEKVAETVDKVATIESKLDNLAAMVQQLVESQQKPREITIETKVEGNAEAIIKEVEKLNKKKPAKTEVVETDAVAESEAETPEADESEA